MPVCHIVDLNDRRNGAAAKASDFLHGEQKIRIRILAPFDVQFTAESIVYQFGSFDMTCRAGADTDNVFSDRGVAELGIKGRNTRYRGWCYLRDFTNSPECTLWKIVIFLLNSMQNRDYIPGFYSDLSDNLVDKRKDAVCFLFHDRSIFPCSTNFLFPGYKFDWT